MARTKLSNDSVGSDQLAHDLALQGNPTGTTQSSGNNTTRIATTAFVTAATSGLATDTNLANKAPINSPTFTGTPAAPTASSGTNTTQLATTAFVTTAVGGASVTGISSSADATAITIDSSERVGIGATSPVTTLEVEGAGTELIRVSSSSGNGGLAAGTGALGLDFFTGSTHPAVLLSATEAPGTSTYLSDFTISLRASNADAAPTERFRINSTGNVSIVDGNVSFADGHGIDFSAKTPDESGAGSMANELLDDYEEGTWTPAYGVSTGSFTTLTHSVQTGYYTKVGDVCTAVGRLDTTAMSIGSASNYLFITGFPFASKVGAYQSGVIGYSYGYSSVWANAIAFQGSTNYVYLFSVDDGANSNTIGPSNLGTGQTYLYFSITYITT